MGRRILDPLAWDDKLKSLMLQERTTEYAKPMTQRFFVLFTMFLLLGSLTAALAKSKPEIKVELVPSNATKGETITANVWIQQRGQHRRCRYWHRDR